MRNQRKRTARLGKDRGGLTTLCFAKSFGPTGKKPRPRDASHAAARLHRFPGRPSGGAAAVPLRAGRALWARSARPRRRRREWRSCSCEALRASLVRLLAYCSFSLRHAPERNSLLPGFVHHAAGFWRAWMPALGRRRRRRGEAMDGEGQVLDLWLSARPNLSLIHELSTGRGSLLLFYCFAFLF